jgi:aminopeptidase N
MKFLALAASATIALSGTPGAPGAGDPYFPDQGNGGYDAQHYDLTLGYDTDSGVLDGVAKMDARATQDLSRFDLDLVATLDVSSVTVDGSTTPFKRDGNELVISPKRGLQSGRPFSVVVRYGGKPEHVVDPDGSSDGWIRTDDGVFNANEPQGAMSWFPGNSHMTDKATYRFNVTVPSTRVVVANGDLLGTVTKGGRTTYQWDEKQPMAAYLATVTIGNFKLTDTHVGKYRVITAVDPRFAGKDGDFAQRTAAVLDYFSSLFGPYPFSSTGGIADYAPDVGYSLETQTRPIYPSVPSNSLLSHELGHQWFGDAVTPTSWKDIWLNEGFATYAQWLYSDHLGTQTEQASFDKAYNRAADSKFWKTPPADPGGGDKIFDSAIYDRGAMTLHALRGAVGDDAFFSILRTWVSTHKYGNADTADFIALSKQISGKDLSALFDTWLYQPAKPAL